ncbi:uncharacterized protein LOC119967452 isoform X3 [Scyliorhinus canicula]|uniref:uncharacterized protein LOC119967452 isoform X3 n=1 Tax=Scyliorhinus canicula TaxID=7830 RepID=UPI0018F307ED|nr:uncharacterized protein LOC119967452 isoform X3 [Scyliorhinus canicula]
MDAKEVRTLGNFFYNSEPVANLLNSGSGASIYTFGSPCKVQASPPSRSGAGLAQWPKQLACNVEQGQQRGFNSHTSLPEQGTRGFSQ